MRVEEFLKEKNINIGDFIRVIKEEDGEEVIYEGYVMPPYELSPGDTLVLKLRKWIQHWNSPQQDQEGRGN